MPSLPPKTRCSVGEKVAPEIYSIAAHRGFADALVAGIVPRYADADLGLARLTLIVPSSRAARTLSEAFVRHTGTAGKRGMLMPRMVAVGDLDLDEALGALLDPLGASEIPPAVEPTRRVLELAQLIALERDKQGDPSIPGAALLRLARETARTMDRLLVEEKLPEDLLSEPVLDMLGDLSEHWRRSLRLFAAVQARWRARLDERGEVDAATRRNMLFARAAKTWRAEPPQSPIIAAGVTSASPALARMLRVIAELPQSAVVLPDLDLQLANEAWEELGGAGASEHPGETRFGSNEALTHPQYHLKLLLERMGIARAEVRPWHRRGEGASEPARSRAISSLFLPPKASRSWITLDPDKRRLSGVRLMTSPTSDEEAQAIAMLVREALETSEKRVAVITADRSLARRVAQHLTRWNIEADDSAGRSLALTSAGRLMGVLSELAAKGPGPVEVIAALAHPLVKREDNEARRAWLRSLRAMDRKLRGPAPAPGLDPLRAVASEAGCADWWEEAVQLLTPLLDLPQSMPLCEALDRLAQVAEALAGDAVWAREDGRALATLIENLRLHSREVETPIAPGDLVSILRDAMDEVAVRPPYGGHPRVAIYGLLESRMARADLVICAGLNEGSWPQAPSADALLAPGVLRALGIPGAEFRIGLAAHDLAGAMGAPEVVLSRAQRDAEGPTLPSRFVLRVEALLGDMVEEHTERAIPAMLPQLGRAAEPAPEYPRPMPRPTAEQRKASISATALDRLLGDPYQFYARQVLGLSQLDPLAADPFNDPALRGTLVHEILDAWHSLRASGRTSGRADGDAAPIGPFAEEFLRNKPVHPLFWGLWRPRLVTALERFEQWIIEDEALGARTLSTEIKGAMRVDGITVHGVADRIDRLPDGSLAIIDYKSGKPPTKKEVAKGYRLQLGVLGLIARDGAFKHKDDPESSAISGDATRFEFWSLRKQDGEFGERFSPLKLSSRQDGLEPQEFLPEHKEKLHTAITKYLNGDAPFTAKENPDYPGYSEYDQLMRLEEWVIRLSAIGAEHEGAS